MPTRPACMRYCAFWPSLAIWPSMSLACATPSLIARKPPRMPRCSGGRHLARRVLKLLDVLEEAHAQTVAPGEARANANLVSGRSHGVRNASGTDSPASRLTVTIRRPSWTAARGSPNRPGLRLGHERVDVRDDRDEPPEPRGLVAAGTRRPDDLEDHLAEPEEPLVQRVGVLAHAAQVQTGRPQRREGPLQVGRVHDDVIDADGAVRVRGPGRELRRRPRRSRARRSRSRAHRAAPRTAGRPRRRRARSSSSRPWCGRRRPRTPAAATRTARLRRRAAAIVGPGMPGAYAGKPAAACASVSPSCCAIDGQANRCATSCAGRCRAGAARPDR